MAEIVRHHDNPAHPRSPKWPAVEHAHLKEQPACLGCGSKNDLNVHHVQPFHEHPELELVGSNLVTVCRFCHFVLCHLNDWSGSDPNCLKVLAAHLKLVAASREALKHGRANQPGRGPGQ